MFGQALNFDKDHAETREGLRTGKDLIKATVPFAEVSVRRSWCHVGTTFARQAAALTGAGLAPWWPLKLLFSLLASTARRIRSYRVRFEFDCMRWQAPLTVSGAPRMNHRHANLQFANKTVSYETTSELRETLAVIKIAQNALINKRLRTLAHTSKISKLYLYYTSACARIGDSHPTGPSKMPVLYLCIL